jgi:hypothetical protein
MPELPVYAARNGQHGSWYIDVDEYHNYIPVLHYILVGPGSKPWPQNKQFLHGNLYDQTCSKDAPEKAAQAERMRHLGKVVMTIDFWEEEWPKMRPNSIRMRISYVGVFNAHDAAYRDRHLRFRLGAQLCWLLRPSDFRK